MVDRTKPCRHCSMIPRTLMGKAADLRRALIGNTAKYLQKTCVYPQLIVDNEKDRRHLKSEKWGLVSRTGYVGDRWLVN
jgi:hypothetical protein